MKQFMDDVCQPQPPCPWMLNERDRYAWAKKLYGFFSEQQNLPEHEREWSSDIDDAMRIVLYLFPELVVLRGLAMPASRITPAAPIDDNIIYLR